MIAKSKVQINKKAKGQAKELTDVLKSVAENEGILKEKWMKMKTIMSHIASILRSLRDSIKPLNIHNRDEVITDVEFLMEMIASDLAKVEEFSKAKFEKFKKSQSTITIVTMAGALVGFEKYLESVAMMRTVPGMTWEPYLKIKFNIKSILHIEKEAILQHKILQLFNTNSVMFHDALNMPEIEIAKLKGVVLSFIASEREKNTQRGMKEVFDTLERAVDRFEGNFESYYRDSVQSGNDATMVERLIADTTEDLMKQHSENKTRGKKGRGMLSLIRNMNKLMGEITDRIRKSGNKDAIAVANKLNKLSNDAKVKIEGETNEEEG